MCKLTVTTNKQIINSLDNKMMTKNDKNHLYEMLKKIDGSYKVIKRMKIMN